MMLFAWTFAIVFLLALLVLRLFQWEVGSADPLWVDAALAGICGLVLALAVCGATSLVGEVIG